MLSQLIVGGNEKEYSFESLSLGAIDLARCKFSTSCQIIDICTEPEISAKAQQGSNLFADQRQDD